MLFQILKTANLTFCFSAGVSIKQQGNILWSSNFDLCHQYSQLSPHNCTNRLIFRGFSDDVFWSMYCRFSISAAKLCLNSFRTVHAAKYKNNFWVICCQWMLQNMQVHFIISLNNSHRFPRLKFTNVCKSYIIISKKNKTATLNAHSDCRGLHIHLLIFSSHVQHVRDLDFIWPAHNCNLCSEDWEPCSKGYFGEFK